MLGRRGCSAPSAGGRAEITQKRRESNINKRQHCWLRKSNLKDKVTWKLPLLLAINQHFSMESPSPLLSTPLTGVSLRGKWTFHPCTPGVDYGVRKKLFDLEGQEDAALADENQWSSSSEYFSQSINDLSASGESHSNLFDDEYSLEQVLKCMDGYS